VVLAFVTVVMAIIAVLDWAFFAVVDFAFRAPTK
jgi:preprotein translocase subunit SecE